VTSSLHFLELLQDSARHTLGQLRIFYTFLLENLRGFTLKCLEICSFQFQSLELCSFLLAFSFLVFYDAKANLTLGTVTQVASGVADEGFPKHRPASIGHFGQNGWNYREILHISASADDAPNSAGCYANDIQREGMDKQQSLFAANGEVLSPPFDTPRTQTDVAADA
jgi:hypothetical protein